MEEVDFPSNNFMAIPELQLRGLSSKVRQYPLFFEKLSTGADAGKTLDYLCRVYADIEISWTPGACGPTPAEFANVVAKF